MPWGWADWFVFATPLLHGATGAWDELACLALPLFVAVTLWMLSRKPVVEEDGSPADAQPPEEAEEEV